MVTDITKKWKRKFFDCVEKEPEGKKRDVIELAKHGMKLKGKKNANSHSKEGD